MKKVVGMVLGLMLGLLAACQGPLEPAVVITESDS
jgi:hypothetical protein